jgi:hypothetical protein
MQAAYQADKPFLEAIMNFLCHYGLSSPNLSNCEKNGQKLERLGDCAVAPIHLRPYL